MDFSALIQAGLNMVRQHVPIIDQVVNLAEGAGNIAQAVQPAKAAVESGIEFLNALKPHAPPETQAEIDAELTGLRAKRDQVMAHADKTIGSLTDD